MSNFPLISVITTVRNGEQFIPEAARSILVQTYRNFEYIIVDDGSTDNTLALLRQLKSDPKVTLIPFSANIGRVASLNRALQEARGKYIALHDADDISLPDRLSLQCAFMEANPDHVLTGSNIVEIDKSGIEIAHPRKPELNDDLQFIMLFKCTLSNPSTMFRSDIVRSAGIRYEDRFIHAEDFGFISRLIRHGKVHNLKEVLLMYRRHETNNSKVNNKQLELSSIEIARMNLSRLGVDLESHQVRRLRSLLSSKGISREYILDDVNSLADVIEVFIEKRRPQVFGEIRKLLERMPRWLGRKNLLVKPSFRRLNLRIKRLTNHLNP